MATTTATITLSSDLLSDSISVTADTTCMKAGTTADGLDQMRMGMTKVPTGTSFDLIDATAAHIDKANKIYISNKATDNTLYVDVYINTLNIGRLYAGDWAFFPWIANASTNDIKIDPSANDMTLEYMLFTDE